MIAPDIQAALTAIALLSFIAGAICGALVIAFTWWLA